MVNDCHSLVTHSRVRNQALTYTLECKCEVGGVKEREGGFTVAKKSKKSQGLYTTCIRHEELYNCPRQSLGTETLQSILKFDALKD